MWSPSEQARKDIKVVGIAAVLALFGPVLLASLFSLPVTAVSRWTLPVIYLLYVALVRATPEPSWKYKLGYLALAVGIIGTSNLLLGFLPGSEVLTLAVVYVFLKI